MVFLLIDTLLVTLALMIAWPAAVFLAQCLCAQLPRRRIRGLGSAPLPRYAVLIPAHNEELVIGATLDAVMPQVGDRGRVLVVADNCSDRTAAIARERGARVVERHEPHLRGKGYALDLGVRVLAADSPEVIVFVDADCVPGAGAIETLARAAWVTGGPVQAVNLVLAPRGSGLANQVSAFAFQVKNLVRLRGMDRLGMPSHLTGTGMAVPVALIGRVTLAHGEILEDINFGLDLLEAGHPPRFCEDAGVTSALPRGKAVATGQRLRWDHGGLLLVKRSPRLLWGALRRADLRRLGIAIDLTVPPVAGLCIAGLVVLGLTAAAAWAGAHPAALWLTAGAMGAIALGAGLSWAKFGRRIVPATALLGAPAYMLWKLPIYLRFFVRPHRDWNPTQREPL